MLIDEEGNKVYKQADLGQLAIKHFQNMFATIPLTEDNVDRFYSSPIPPSISAGLVQPVSVEEIKQTLFSISDSKAPGPDGFTSIFFKCSWEIIGIDFTEAIKFFFDKNFLPHCINATRIALVLKVENPSCMDDFRFISCCNAIYKCISKVLAARLKTILPDVINHSQSTFVLGRQISDNILLTQEIMHNYHLDNGPPKCALKVDLRKAFDMVSWEYILKGLRAICMPECMVNWIYTCISMTHFSVGLNGESYGFFKSSRGIGFRV